MQQDATDIAQALRTAQALVDVRSPQEFFRGAIPGAINLPLFSDGERAEIGTLYKTLGKDHAIQRGLDCVGGHLGAFVARFERFRQQELLVYCARGGMRSAAVVGLLQALGFRVRRMAGGYKAYRTYLLGELERRVPGGLIVLHGQTGVGKTLLLRRLPNFLDLEDIAQHRSSLFGGVNRQPRTQQHFEAQLLQVFQGLDSSLPVWVEGESRKVGTVVLPQALRTAMQGATCVLVVASMETRIQRIISEYLGAAADLGPTAAGEHTMAQLEQSVRALAGFFGAARTQDLVTQLRQGQWEHLVRTLLEEYYDPRYRHAMRGYRYALTISSEDLEEALGALRGLGNQLGLPGGAPPAAPQPAGLPA